MLGGNRNPCLRDNQDLDCVKVIPPQEHGNPHQQADQDEEGPAGHHRIPHGGNIFPQSLTLSFSFPCSLLALST